MNAARARASLPCRLIASTTLLVAGSTAFALDSAPRLDPWPYVTLALALFVLLMGWGFARQRRRLRDLEVRRTELERLVESRDQDLASLHRKLETIGQTDPLTGLRSRHYLGIQLPADVAYYEREILASGRDDLVLMLAFVDIDAFKSINERYGNETGDQVLKEFARIFGAQVRTGDYVLRWGGEEFVLLFRPMAAAEPARIAERIRRAVAAHGFTAEGASPFNTTCTIGFIQISLSPGAKRGLDWEEIIALADQALYFAKSNGRDGWAGVILKPGDSTQNLIQDFERDPAGLRTSGRLVWMGDALEVSSSAAGVP